VTAKKKSSKPKAPAPQPIKEASELDARGHKAGSRKAKVHALHDKEGPEAAFTLGRKLQLKEGTLHSWFGMWRRQAAKAKSPAKAKEQPPKAEAAQAAA